MSFEELAQKHVALVEQPLVGVLGTISPSGTPHLAAVWYAVQGGAFLISTAASSRKVKNVLANPAAELCVNAGLVGPCVTASGEASIAGRSSLEFVAELARRYLGEEGGAQYMAVRDPNADSVVLVLRPASWRFWDVEPAMGES